MYQSFKHIILKLKKLQYSVLKLKKGRVVIHGFSVQNKNAENVYFGGSVLMPYFSLRSFNCSSFFFVSIF